MTKTTWLAAALTLGPAFAAPAADAANFANAPSSDAFAPFGAGGTPW